MITTAKENVFLIFLAAFLLFTGVPALLFRPLVGCHRSVVALALLRRCEIRSAP